MSFLLPTFPSCAKLTAVWTKPNLKAQKFYRLNQYISAPTLRVLNEEGKQIGILTREEALKKAQEEKLDLVEIAPQANPPVVKIIDFKKFKYLEEKKEKKGQKTQKTKEIQMRPFIGENDFNFRLKRAQKWLKEGQNVRITVNFRGREFTQKEAGFDRLEKFSQGVASFGQPKDKPKMMGPNLFIVLEPLKRWSKKRKPKNRWLKDLKLPKAEKFYTAHLLAAILKAPKARAKKAATANQKSLPVKWPKRLRKWRESKLLNYRIVSWLHCFIVGIHELKRMKNE